MFRFFKYLRFKFLKKKKFIQLKEKSISISYIEFEYYPYEEKSNIRFITKSDFFF
jgi:hypothetical protein